MLLLPKKTILLIFIIISNVFYNFQLLSAEDDLSSEYGDVVFSSIIFRHGARNRIFTYPTDPHIEFHKKTGMWLLSPEGKLEVYELGKWARERYIKLVEGKPYTPEAIIASSTQSDRTIASAQIFLTGFYPPLFENEIAIPTLLWQPIPVFSTPKYLDKMLLLEKYCSRYNLEMLRVNNSPEIKEFFDNYKQVFEYVEGHAQITIPRGDIATAINAILHIRDNLLIDERFGLQLPQWAGKVYPQPLKEMSLMFYKIQTYNDVMKRLKGGLLLKNIIDDMIERRDKEDSEKHFHIYSGHDTTISVLLRTLGIFNDIHPPYSSAVLVELRQQNQNHFVTVSYRNSTTVPPYLLEMTNCGNPCPLNKFIESTESMIPEDWEHECQHFEPDYNTILF